MKNYQSTGKTMDKNEAIARIVDALKRGQDVIEVAYTATPEAPTRAVFADMFKAIIDEVSDRYSVTFRPPQETDHNGRYSLKYKVSRIKPGSPIKARVAKPWHALSVGHRLSVGTEGDHFTITRKG